MLLEAGDALAHRRLAQAQAFAGGGKAAGFGDGDEGVEAGQIHARIPFGYPKYEKYEFVLSEASP
ncbi:hypothetical protein D3C87_2123840 [compost metagenome]